MSKKIITKDEYTAVDKANSKDSSARQVHVKEIVEFHLKVKNIRNIIYDVFSPHAALRQHKDTAQ